MSMILKESFLINSLKDFLKPLPSKKELIQLNANYAGCWLMVHYYVIFCGIMKKIRTNHFFIINILSFFVLSSCASNNEVAKFEQKPIRARDLISIAEHIKPKSVVFHEEIINIPHSVRSPDGKRVAGAERVRAGIESQVFIVSVSNVDDKSEIKIAEVVNFFGLCWSPDGSKIAYSEGTMVHIADSDGKTKRVSISDGQEMAASFPLCRWKMYETMSLRIPLLSQ